MCTILPVSQADWQGPSRPASGGRRASGPGAGGVDHAGFAGGPMVTLRSVAGAITSARMGRGRPPPRPRWSPPRAGQALEHLGDAERLLAGARIGVGGSVGWHRHAGAVGEARQVERPADDRRDPDQPQLHRASARSAASSIGPHRLGRHVGDAAQVDGVHRTLERPAARRGPGRRWSPRAGRRGRAWRCARSTDHRGRRRAEVAAARARGRPAATRTLERGSAEDGRAGSGGELVQALLEGEHLVGRAPARRRVGAAGDARGSPRPGPARPARRTPRGRPRPGRRCARARRRPRPARAARGRPPARQQSRGPGSRSSPAPRCVWITLSPRCTASAIRASIRRSADVGHRAGAASVRGAVACLGGSHRPDGIAPAPSPLGVAWVQPGSHVGYGRKSLAPAQTPLAATSRQVRSSVPGAVSAP